jgi:selenoprotein W-related protein
LPGGVTLVPGSGGIFEVTLDGQVLFSKAQTGRFPNPNEIEEKLESLLGESR